MDALVNRFIMIALWLSARSRYGPAWPSCSLPDNGPPIQPAAWPFRRLSSQPATLAGLLSRSLPTDSPCSQSIPTCPTRNLISCSTQFSHLKLKMVRDLIGQLHALCHLFAPVHPLVYKFAACSIRTPTRHVCAPVRCTSEAETLFLPRSHSVTVEET